MSIVIRPLIDDTSYVDHHNPLRARLGTGIGMDEYDVYQVGGRLWSFRRLLKSSGSFETLARRFQRLELLISTVAVRHEPRNATRLPRNPSSDTYFIARILLGILQRGHSAYVTSSVESSILSGHLPLDAAMASPVVDHLLSPKDPERFVEDVLGHLITPEPALQHDWSSLFESESERRFLEEPLTELLGPGVALVEAQRPLGTMVAEGDEFPGQRVDFALETPSGTRIVFEVDGHPFHRGHQERVDQRRNKALEQAGWLVQRIPTDDIWRGQLLFEEHIRERVHRDSTLSLLRTTPPADSAHDNPYDLALRVAIAPHAVARVQLAILLAMLNGELGFDQPRWSIGIIERDLPCAELAVRDLMDQMMHLGQLYGIGTDTHIDLRIVPAHAADIVPQPGLSGNQQVHVEYASVSEFFERTAALDVVIDVSVRSRPYDRRSNDPVPRNYLTGLTSVYELRSAYRRAPETFVPWPDPRPIPAPDSSEESLLYFLRMLFRKPDFMPLQLDIVKRAMQRKDVLGLLPTGGGKSLTFQLVTLLSPGVAIVVAPLKSLIDDQWDNLNRAGINRVVATHSGHSLKKREQTLREITAGYPRFIYIAPERFHIKRFREEMLQSPISRSLCFAIVDEAHCVSEWGHNFRPSYLSVSRQVRSLFRSPSGTTPIIALTATASTTVLTDILRELEIDRDDAGSLVSVKSFRRENLKFMPIVGPPNNKKRDLDRAIDAICRELGVTRDELLQDPDRAGVVFCRYVNGQYGVVGVNGLIRQQTPDPSGVQIYAGGKPKNWSAQVDWEEHKKLIQKEFKEDRFPLLVATSSFGMGIDKPNIRYTIHYGIPPSLESLVQEAGRAGRDRQDSVCAVVFTDEDIAPENDYFAPELDPETARERAKLLSRSEQGDASRLMYLHGTSFPGVEPELAELKSTFSKLVAAWREKHVPKSGQTFVTVARPRHEPAVSMFDKSLYRLTVLGAIVDYTIDYRTNMVEVLTVNVTPSQMESALSVFVQRYDAADRASRIMKKAYASRSMEEPFAHILRAMCEFSYEVIERSRREAMKRVVDAMREVQEDGEALGRLLNEYLSTNTFTGLVAEATGRNDVDEWFEILQKSFNTEHARQLVYAAERELESNATHAGLHLLAGLGNVRRDGIPPRSIAQRVITSLRNYEYSYGKSAHERRELASRIIAYIRTIRPDRLDAVVAVLVSEFNDQDTAMAAYPYVASLDLKRKCAVPWLRHASDTARALRETVLEKSR